jgi:hypothetical protein
MAELLVRAGVPDAALMGRILAAPPIRPDRVVVDAHVAATTSKIAHAARAAGVPFLVDPQTYLLTDRQPPTDPWARLPFADPNARTRGDLLSGADRWTAAVVDYQLAAGATTLIAPYLHLQGHAKDELPAQIKWWRATRRHLDRSGLRLPVVAVIALGWRLLDRARWPDALDPLLGALDMLGAEEVALAASKVDAGAQADDRLASFLAVVEQVRRSYPVIAWQQGTLGEAAVVSGAAGYESGIGWRERCDLPAAMARRRAPRASRGGPRPVYVNALKKSIPQRSVRTLLASKPRYAEIVCLDSSCCPRGRDGMLGDVRAHAVRARLRGVADLTRPSHPRWRWGMLAEQAARGVSLAASINQLSENTAGVSRVDDTALRAVKAIAEQRRQGSSHRRAA